MTFVTLKKEPPQPQKYWAVGLASVFWVVAASTAVLVASGGTPLWLQGAVWMVVFLVLTALCSIAQPWQESVKEAFAVTGVAVVLFSFVGGDVRDEETLRARGDKVEVQVADEYVEKRPGQRPSVIYRYKLVHDDGSVVPGPRFTEWTGERREVGEKFTVIEDPVGGLKPEIPGDVGSTFPRLLLAGGGLSLVAVMAYWNRKRYVKAREDCLRSDPSTHEHREHLKRVEAQERKLRGTLNGKTGDSGWNGLCTLKASEYPDLGFSRVSSIASEYDLQTFRKNEHKRKEWWFRNEQRMRSWAGRPS